MFYGDDFTMGYLGTDYQPITFSTEDIPGLDRQLQTLADSGDPEAQHELGKQLWYGLGRRKDTAVGFAYVKRAAHQGDTRAQLTLAEFYFYEPPSKGNYALALM